MKSGRIRAIGIDLGTTNSAVTEIVWDPDSGFSSGVGAGQIVPPTLRYDNGSEFISRVLDKWAYEHGVTMDFSRPGKPMDNVMIESFKRSFRVSA